MASIADLKVGQYARVTRLHGKASYYRQRLIAEGIIPGARIKVRWMAPLGDPIVIAIQEDASSLSLRKNEAKIIEVVPE